MGKELIVEILPIDQKVDKKYKEKSIGMVRLNNVLESAYFYEYNDGENKCSKIIEVIPTGEFFDRRYEYFVSIHEENYAPLIIKKYRKSRFSKNIFNMFRLGISSSSENLVLKTFGEFNHEDKIYHVHAELELTITGHEQIQKTINNLPLSKFVYYHLEVCLKECITFMYNQLNESNLYAKIQDQLTLTEEKIIAYLSQK